MPRIKEYTNQVGGAQELPLSQVTRQAYASDFNGAGVGMSMLGNAVDRGANDLTQAYRLMEEAKARQEVTDAAVELSRFNASAAHELQQAKNSGAMDDDSYTEQYMARISTNLDSVGQKFQTAQGRQAWERGSAATQAHYLVQAGEMQSQMAGVKAVAQYKDFVASSSNAVMMNPFDFERIEQSAADVINDPRGVFSKIPAEKRDELALMAKQQLAQSAAQGVIRLDPTLGMELLTKGKYASYLSPDATHALMTEARVGIAGQEAEARRQEAEAERQRKKEVTATQDKFIGLLAADQLTVPMILESNLPPVGDGSKEHMINVLNAKNKITQEAPIKRDPGTFIDVLQGIRDGKITSEQQIEQKFMDSAHLGVGITWEDTKQLRQELKDIRTPDGEKLGAQVKSFMDGYAPLIDKSNPTMGKIDFSGKAQLYRFSTMVNDKVNEYKQAGKDPRVLLDPNSPEFLGSPKTLAPYETTLKQSSDNIKEMFNRGRVEKPPSASTSPGVFQWFKDKFKPADEPQMLDPNGPPVAAPKSGEPSMLDPNGPPVTSSTYKKGSKTHQQAVASLEEAVKTMPGQEPIMVEPRKHGESAADFLKRWNKAHGK